MFKLYKWCTFQTSKIATKARSWMVSHSQVAQSEMEPQRAEIVTEETRIHHTDTAQLSNTHRWANQSRMPKSIPYGDASVVRGCGLRVASRKSRK